MSLPLRTKKIYFQGNRLCYTDIVRSLISGKVPGLGGIRHLATAARPTLLEMDPSNGSSSDQRHHHDVHGVPPQAICEAFKRYQRMSDEEIDADPEIIDFSRGLSPSQKEKLRPVRTVSKEAIAVAQKAFKFHGREAKEMSEDEINQIRDCTVYEHVDFHGLRLYPSLLPPESQIILLDKLLHRDLSNPLHITNMHANYDLPYPDPSTDSDDSSTSTSKAKPSIASQYPTSFFTCPQNSPSPKDRLTPKPQSQQPSSTSNSNPNLNSTTATSSPYHTPQSLKPLPIAQFLHKKLHYLTIGSQYDWPTRRYPRETPTPFPSDIAALVTSLFGDFVPESGVVLLYSPKDYMPVHRDVSEECGKGLASFSLGCDGLFVVAREKEKNGILDIDARDNVNGLQSQREMEMVIIRVRSGDVVQMAEETRFAWHAMPKVMAGTCPEWLKDWPAVKLEGRDKDFVRWKGYMERKRLNISCRQVWD
ncbi:hypothetical protein F5884DRAFT_777894 [Xylogone sp. PMI_703]|nr:hypothetical protein F5884DRAFT_777894 [Xylogone sp. PMI_703]